MNRSTSLLSSVLATTLVAALAAPALASPDAAADAAPATAPAATLHGPRELHADAEIDPTAYALAGNSIHVGIGYRHLRVDLGNFAMALPAFAHADDGFDVSFTGYGAKLQYFGSAAQRGWFAGIDAGVLKLDARRQGTDLAGHQVQIGAGVHAGYRIALPAGFYATPWLGVGYNFNTSPITLGGSTYTPSKFSVFPAVHLGYQFR
ncbi:MAG: hypothetical protein K8W52_34730 [Deltaproteobacteria bacterium]|nr:hypothetical protein [Deltaproteobacteria bacterium]